MTGRVWLIGAGPGDPGLITVRGLELLRACDAVVYDRLVAPELVDEAPADAIRIGREPLEQTEINQVLVRLARRGLDVVRLKGGDPFLFGRGGEEALALVDAGIRFEVVPGVSSQVTIVNGHGPLDFAALAAAPGTLVVFMGLGRLGELAEGLIDHGRAASTPTAVIASGTLPEQRVVVAPLHRIADAAEDVEPPALVVIGDVVAIRELLRALPQVAAA